jgi:molybdopterin-guanine dinucleotide biosynthesis protein A
MTQGLPNWDAVVVAGGASRRMGGTDKLMLHVGGRPLIASVVAAVSGASRVIVVGPVRPIEVDANLDLVWCQETPPGGGPAAALGAALAHVTSPVTVLLAGDLPFLDAATVEQLVSAIGAADGAVAVDRDEQPQWLCSAWRTPALGAAALCRDGSLRRALSSSAWTPVPLDRTRIIDCDTPEDLRRARERAT